MVTWHRPKFDSARFDRQTYDALPETIEMRELRYEAPQDDFRTQTVVVAATLKDAERYSKEEIAWLYRERWHCELDLRSLKSVMKMAHLRCRTPAMVRKEVWTHLLAYNLVRVKMGEAAKAHDAQPRRLSFRNAQQAIDSFTPKLATANVQRHSHIRAEMLRSIAHVRVGDRLDRSEPRKVKKRHNKYPYLTEARHAA